MTKILMTSVRPDEEAAIQAAEKRLGVEIVTSDKLIQDSLDLVEGVDGLVIQQRAAVPAEVYPALQAAGLRQRPDGDQCASLLATERSRVRPDADLPSLAPHRPV